VAAIGCTYSILFKASSRHDKIGLAREQILSIQEEAL
jgi:hypothetical protein